MSAVEGTPTPTTTTTSSSTAGGGGGGGTELNAAEEEELLNTNGARRGLIGGMLYAAVHLLVLALAFGVLQTWVAYGAGECPRAPAYA
jgi:hypothetical protein